MDFFRKLHTTMLREFLTIENPMERRRVTHVYQISNPTSDPIESSIVKSAIS